MSWVNEPKRSWIEWAALRVLRIGPIPRHVAFIMDGNRRFAKQLEKNPIDGHTEGFRKLTEVLSWCRDLGIPEVTVYAFSIENFKRSKSEVDGLMALAEEKFEKLLQEKDLLSKHGVRIRVFGCLSMLTPRLRSLIAQAVLATENNSNCCLNLAMAYTSRQEVVSAVRDAVQAVKVGCIRKEDLSESLLEECLYTSGTRDPELLIRTSGEVRLSDFLLWQTGLSYLYFTKVLWPEISLWHFLAAVFHYQRHHHTLVQLRREESRKLAKDRIVRSDESEKDDIYKNISIDLFHKIGIDGVKEIYPDQGLESRNSKNKNLKDFVQFLRGRRRAQLMNYL